MKNYKRFFPHFQIQKPLSLIIPKIINKCFPKNPGKFTEYA